MDTRATSFPNHPPQPRKPVVRAVTASKPVDAVALGYQGPYHAGLSYDGLGAINAARLSQQRSGDRPMATLLNASAAEAYRRSQSAI